MQRTSKILSCLLIDMANKCSTEMQIRDLHTIERRLLHEGLSFVTITLPTFLDDFNSSLEEGMVTSDRFVGWKKRQCLPSFLRGFTSLVFCSKTGRIVNEPNKIAVHCIRQLCSTFKKVKLSCTSARVEKAYASYKRIEDSLAGLVETISAEKLEEFDRVSGILWSEVFGGEINEESLVPHHGPGSTADRLTGNRKYDQRKVCWPKRLEKHFSPGICIFNTEESYYQSDVAVTEVGESCELPVRVITVPKTLKTPRIIALEPTAMQMAQQSVKDFIVDKLESSRLTAGHINFTDQSINRELALSSSVSRRFATLDLSAASDRVHKDLVWRMLRVHPQLRSLVFTTRSTRAKLPDSEPIVLNKFASMGSALCFPIEAMFFTVLLVMARLEHKALPATYDNVYRVMRQIYVYGDDIIIPTNEVEVAVRTLSEFGNVVGLKKSFSTGHFRESCGMDAFLGYNVTPIYMRNPIPSTSSDASAIISTVSTINQLFRRGFITLSSYLKQEVERVVGNLPTVSPNSEGLGFSLEVQPTDSIRRRYNRALQRVEVRTLVPKLSLKKDSINGYSALCKCLIKLSMKNRKYEVQNDWQRKHQMLLSATFEDKRHLSYSPRNGFLTLKSRWVAA